MTRIAAILAAVVVFLPLVSGSRPAAECAPSYPTVCIPAPPPDLNCADVFPLTDFQTLPPDPHNFDADHDGIGCEKPKPAVYGGISTIFY